jgi:agmatinase
VFRDSWKPKVFGGSPSEVAAINHGTYFYHAAMEGLLRNDTNIHAGIRTTLSGPSDYDNDGYCGFEIVEAREIDVIGMLSCRLVADWLLFVLTIVLGTDGIIKKIRDRVGTDNPVYLSIDIDTLDPACRSFLEMSIVACSVAKNTIQSHRLLARQRLAGGPRANCEQSSVVLTG